MRYFGTVVLDEETSLRKNMDVVRSGWCLLNNKQYHLAGI